MAKQAISVTLETDNLAWVRGRALAAGRISVSDMLDRLIAAARSGRSGERAAAGSVVGRVEIADEDPALETADDAVRALFARSLSLSPRPTQSRSARGGRSVKSRARG
jgi:hypothetical protein